MANDFQAAEFADFSGGITDYPINCPPNRYARAVNLDIDPNKKLDQRPGSAIWDATCYQIPPGAQRINAILSWAPGSGVANEGSMLGVWSGKNMYYKVLDVPLAIFTREATHLGAPPANAASVVKYPFPYVAEWRTVTGLSGDPVFGYNGNSALQDGDVNCRVSYAVWEKQVFATNDARVRPVRLYNGILNESKFDGGVTYYRSSLDTIIPQTLGLPRPAAPVFTTVGGAGPAVTYLYAFMFKRVIRVDNKIFYEDGPVTYYELSSNTVESGATISIDQFKINDMLAPLITANNEGEHHVIGLSTPVSVFQPYRYPNCALYIFRTKANGSVFYPDTARGYGATWTDTATDAFLEAGVGGLPFYGNGGVVDNEQPPKCKYLTIANNVMYFGNLAIPETSPSTGTTTVSYLTNRVQLSKSEQFYAAPGSFYWDADEEITALGQVNEIPVAFCTGRIYRLEGTFDDLGRGFVTGVPIAEKTGCISNSSLVRTKDGLFFAGADGFYRTDGYQVLRVSDFIDTYSAMTSTATKRGRIIGALDVKNSRIVWTAQTDSGGSDNDTLFVLHLNHMGFTTWSGSTNFKPTAVCYHEGQIIRADSRGYIFKHDSSYKTDPAVNVATNPSTWLTAPILFDFRSGISNLGTGAVRKWVPKVLVTVENSGDLSLQLKSHNDNTGTYVSLKEIRDRGTVGGIIEKWRWFPARGLRCSYKQICMENAFSIVANSDTDGTATVNDVAKTALLDTPGETWPTDAVGYTIYFATDNYTQGYPITIRTPDTITFSDPGGVVTAGSKEWVIKGYHRGEQFNLLSYVIYFKSITDTQKGYESGETGENA